MLNRLWEPWQAAGGAKNPLSPSELIAKEQMLRPRPVKIESWRGTVIEA